VICLAALPAPAGVLAIALALAAALGATLAALRPPILDSGCQDRLAASAHTTVKCLQSTNVQGLRRV